MGFNTFAVALGGPVGTGFACSLKKLRSAKASLGFTVRPGVAQQLGWDSEKRLAVLLGDGADHGLIRFRPDPEGSALLKLREAGDHRRGGAYFAITLGHVPQFVDRSEPRRWVRFEQLNDGWVEVVLPSWADETGPARQRSAAPPARAPLVPPPQRPTGAELTSRVMGDPPPGRSALEQRETKR